MDQNTEMMVPDQKLTILDTPLGLNLDPNPKIQICLEFRKKETKGRTNKTKKVNKILQVTVMWVKNLPQSQGKRPNPIVKLQLGDIIHTTEPETDQNEAQIIEVFEFPMEDVKEPLLKIQVCDRKVTRNARSLGNVAIRLDDLKFNKPVLKWHKLSLEQDAVSL